jgi:orotate phosphoribosyltransferase-like protein
MKDKESVKISLEECNNAIKRAITNLSSNGVYDTKIFSSLLLSKDTIDEFIEKNDLNAKFLC